ncbi:MAG TPA: UDP-N-acetylmuramoyl-L-alanyl-D-glutamate--2,6-diaminopimelate ligase [Egibacteraceae bacterium]|nr:UDP-N-acetylmuramoyl-L-alanyl-D-glutamate--2,6-diaminopimelate ligase [Egibacteraceae bacterium]
MPSTPFPSDRRRMTTLSDLLSVLPAKARLHVPRGRDEVRAVTISDVTHDSGEAGPGVLFACRPGRHLDGHDFAPSAVAAGSPALLVERILDPDVPQIRVPSVADALGDVAAEVHGHPSTSLQLAGVTGTNGKTTIVFLLEAVLAAAGHTTGVVGTVSTRIAGQSVPGARTTPEASDLQRLLRRMVDAGVTAAAMEVSSHALALGRVTGTRFAVAVFTNLTQDHLDFHADIEDYFAAKARLFTPGFTPSAVVNVDDPFGRRLAEQTPVQVVRVGSSPGDHVTAREVNSGPAGSAFTALLRGRPVAVRTHLTGHFNVTNALCALAAADVMGIDAGTAAAGIAALPGVPGRMERVEAGQPFTVLVDYAHTPDSLENVLGAARAISTSRVLVVVGCGGERDRGKRPLMGRIAAEGADLAVLTSDNPRGEDPMAILDAMAAGARTVPGGTYTVEPSRRAAIAQALGEARPGDVVVIAGKGHETHQELADRVVDFDDRVVARELLTSGTVAS